MPEDRILRRCSLGSERVPEQLIDELKQALRAHPLVKEALLFGSLANGNSDRHSDVDLILVADTRRPFLERFRDFSSLFEICSDLDLLVYTPQEFDSIRENPSPGFWKSVLQEAKQMKP